MSDYYGSRIYNLLLEIQTENNSFYEDLLAKVDLLIAGVLVFGFVFLAFQFMKKRWIL